MDMGIDIGYNNDTRKEQLLVFPVGRELLRIRGQGSDLIRQGGDEMPEETDAFYSWGN